jgi:hypothetical protein
LSTEQQERLTTLGMQPPAIPSPAPAAGARRRERAKGRRRSSGVWQPSRSGWEGADRPVPRTHSEQITVDSETEPVTVKLGVWISNTKQRRDKLTALAALGIDCAAATPAGAAGDSR